jgi:hypothetical protein
MHSNVFSHPSIDVATFKWRGTWHLRNRRVLSTRRSGGATLQNFVLFSADMRQTFRLDI